jgi:Trypsin-like peptidase domain
MRRLGIMLVVAALLASPIWARGQSMPTSDPSAAVFLLIAYDREPAKDGQWHSHGFGTGFFTAADGTALTVSHVVYRAAHYPKRYRLLAVVGKEFYDATVVCSSKLPYDPTKPDTNRVGIQLTRDVAQVKLAPSNAFEGRKKELYMAARGGDPFVWATAHTDPLPEFPYLTIGKAPASYAHVRVLGYGSIGPMPERWASEGRVDKTGEASDGTPLFDVQSSNPAQPGDSGSPVLNDQGEVVGLWAWHYLNRPTFGTAQDVSALTPACR